jgi:hypothetical protein
MGSQWEPPAPLRIFRGAEEITSIDLGPELSFARGYD